MSGFLTEHYFFCRDFNKKNEYSLSLSISADGSIPAAVSYIIDENVGHTVYKDCGSGHNIVFINTNGPSRILKPKQILAVRQIDR